MVRHENLLFTLLINNPSVQNAILGCIDTRI